MKDSSCSALKAAISWSFASISCDAHVSSHLPSCQSAVAKYVETSHYSSASWILLLLIIDWKTTAHTSPLQRCTDRIFSNPWPVYRWTYHMPTAQLILMSKVFFTTMMFENGSIFWFLTVFQCFGDLLSTSPRLVIDSSSQQRSCIKGRWSKRRHFTIHFKTINQHWHTASELTDCQQPLLVPETLLKFVSQYRLAAKIRYGTIALQLWSSMVQSPYRSAWASTTA